MALHFPGDSDESSRPATAHAYQIALDDGSSVQGATDSSGLSQQVQRPLMHQGSVAALRTGKEETDE
ncbi:hypothetical protein D3C78_1836800 [compost metagenome]